MSTLMVAGWQASEEQRIDLRAASAAALGPPSGEVTFVMTDIVGSTEIFRRVGQAGYVDLLDRHRRALRAAWSNHGGFEVDVTGDAFLVAFARPTSAVEACLAGQAELAAQCPEVPVRMAAHRGWAVPRSTGEYVALTIHETSRVIATAEGNNIVLTEAVREAAPLDLRWLMQSMGLIELRDFERPIELFSMSTTDNGHMHQIRLDKGGDTQWL